MSDAYNMVGLDAYAQALPEGNMLSVKEFLHLESCAAADQTHFTLTRN